jgi:hypothetical protein
MMDPTAEQKVVSFVIQVSAVSCEIAKKQKGVGRHWPMSSERDSFAKGIFSTFAKGFLLHKLLLKVNYSPLRVKKSRSHDMGHYQLIDHFRQQ